MFRLFVYPLKRPRLPWTVIFAMLAFGSVTCGVGQPPPIQRLATSANSASLPRSLSSNQPVDGAHLLERAAVMMASRPAIVAKSRFQIDMFDQHLVGSGSYHEATFSQDRLLRMESKITVAGELASFQRVSDGRYVWTKTDLPGPQGGNVSTVGRIDLQRVAEDRTRSAGGMPLHYPIGGISYVLHNLRSHYTFSEARPLTHQGLPAFLVRGERNMPTTDGHSASSDDLSGREMMPGLVPGVVTLVIGQQDLFPFVMQYHGIPPAASDGATSSSDPVGSATMMTIEYYEVDFPPGLDHGLFFYHVGETSYKDDTDKYLQQRRDGK